MTATGTVRNRSRKQNSGYAHCIALFPFFVVTENFNDKISNLMFYGGRRKWFFFSLWTWIQSVRIQLQEHSLTFEWAETFPMKFEVMQNQKSQCQRIPAGDLNWHNIKNCSNKFPATKTTLYQNNDYQKTPVHKFSPSWPEYWLLIKCYATAQCLKHL